MLKLYEAPSTNFSNIHEIHKHLTFKGEVAPLIWCASREEGITCMRSLSLLYKDLRRSLDEVSMKSWTPYNIMGQACEGIANEIFLVLRQTCHLWNFLALCASGYYDGTIFHRNIKGFMIQGGDPTGTGKGGNSIWGKKFNDEIRESLKHNARGVLSMANSGPNTNGSQFFITYAKQPHLNGLYTIFGRVIHGFEVLDLMEKTPIGPGDRPLAEIRLNRVTIHANPLAG
ncbi:Peptidyl-prolyl cis-trans isomerase-like 2 [Acorus gramineus]|uniref:Peptidyl-prolyl cis-trans isomerase n=1 Tax=Acorus gramineus TaxID=55184 RepID=A0AAV9BCK8_ACOGR|nr:Peptidyl-prolyl cis-trans isomerase-like 2 [Acorus gramineus]